MNKPIPLHNLYHMVKPMNEEKFFKVPLRNQLNEIVDEIYKKRGIEKPYDHHIIYFEIVLTYFHKESVLYRHDGYTPAGVPLFDEAERAELIENVRSLLSEKWDFEFSEWTVFEFEGNDLVKLVIDWREYYYSITSNW